MDNKPSKEKKSSAKRTGKKEKSNTVSAQVSSTENPKSIGNRFVLPIIIAIIIGLATSYFANIVYGKYNQKVISEYHFDSIPVTGVIVKERQDPEILPAVNLRNDILTNNSTPTINNTGTVNIIYNNYTTLSKKEKEGFLTKIKPGETSSKLFGLYVGENLITQPDLMKKLTGFGLPPAKSSGLSKQLIKAVSNKNIKAATISLAASAYAFQLVENTEINMSFKILIALLVMVVVFFLFQKILN